MARQEQGGQRRTDPRERAERALRAWTEAQRTEAYDAQLHAAVANWVQRTLRRGPGVLDPFDIDLA